MKKNGRTAAIVEEGRIHLDITLVFLVNLAVSRSAESQRQQLAQQVKNAVAEMRIAGGSVLPSLPGVQRREDPPQLRLLANDEEERRKDFRRMRYRWLPGFALVARDDLLQERRGSFERLSARSRTRATTFSMRCLAPARLSRWGA